MSIKQQENCGDGGKKSENEEFWEKKKKLLCLAAWIFFKEGVKHKLWQQEEKCGDGEKVKEKKTVLLYKS